jgi:hypothetical protein
MFNWFKRKKSLLANWDFEDIEGFKTIQNPDSIQFVNENCTKIIYFSVLTVDGRGILDGYAGKPIIIETDNGWQLKGSKKASNKILICVISVSSKDDIEWARTFFESITSNELAN